jgi:hypothetical protein
LLRTSSHIFSIALVLYYSQRGRGRKREREREGDTEGDLRIEESREEVVHSDMFKIHWNPFREASISWGLILWIQYLYTLHFLSSLYLLVLFPLFTFISFSILSCAFFI